VAYDKADGTHVESAEPAERCLLCDRRADLAVVWRSHVGGVRRTPFCSRCRHSQDYRDRGQVRSDQREPLPMTF
jgi:hypothetical protein